VIIIKPGHRLKPGLDAGLDAGLDPGLWTLDSGLQILQIKKYQKRPEKKN